jgi:argininosuccinate lyase
MLWGSRLNKKLKNDALRFSSSLPVDIRLYKYDILVNIAHAKMLEHIGILNSDELSLVLEGLQKVKNDIESEKWVADVNEFEDIHSALEKRLTFYIGEVGGKIHTGKSRNDQVVTGVRLWLKDTIRELKAQIISFQKELVNLAEKHVNTIIPGYTHLQRAQPISLGFHLLAYAEMFERSTERLTHVFIETDKCPLGSGALAGSTLPLDREFVASELGFATITKNALDSVSDRDFIIDFLNTCSIGMMNLSRFSEELIIWSSSEWNFVKIADEYSTGSSLMPQKKNPDIAELIRGKCGRVFGNYISLLTTIKGLPLSYNRDLQEDKEPLFDSYDTYLNSLKMLAGIISTISINTNRFVEELNGDFSLATDLADWLVLKNIPFRTSHEIVGHVVKYAEDKNVKLNQLSLDELTKINPIFDETVLDIFQIKDTLSRKKTVGSPNPNLVLKQIDIWKEKLQSKAD